MKFIIFLTLFVILVEGKVIPEDSEIEAWINYKQQYNKKYNSREEENSRFGYFQESLRRIRNHNQENNNNSYQLGLNEFSDFGQSELSRLTGFKNIAKHKLRGREPEIVNETQLRQLIIEWSDLALPEIDWRVRIDVVGPVKNQYECGSCWAFSTTGLLEGQQHKSRFITKNIPVIPLSEEQLISCDDTNLGCNGGQVYDALYYIQAVRGLDTESSYPLTSIKNDTEYECLFNRRTIEPSTTSIHKVLSPTLNDEELLKKLVSNYGPVSAFMHVPDDLFNYVGGVYYNTQCSSDINFEQGDHAVLIVGYGSSKLYGDYWIIKNSWSDQWGERGYFRLARNRANHCCIACQPVFVLSYHQD